MSVLLPSASAVQTLARPLKNPYDVVEARQQFGKHDDEAVLAADHDDQVVAHAEAAERLVDEHVAHVLRGYEARLQRVKDGAAARARLHAEAPEYEESFLVADA